MMLAVQDYDFKVKYTLGLTDALSRLPNPENTSVVKMDVRIEQVQFKVDKIQSLKLHCLVLNITSWVCCDDSSDVWEAGSIA